MAATPRVKIKKKDFEAHLREGYGERLEARGNRENGKSMTLYYEVLPEPDKHGLRTRHCATWKAGEGWEFLAEPDAPMRSVGERMKEYIADEIPARHVRAMQSLETLEPLMAIDPESPIGKSCWEIFRAYSYFILQLECEPATDATAIEDMQLHALPTMFGKMRDEVEAFQPTS